MKKCVKASIVINLKSQVITLDLDKFSDFGLRNETDADGNKIAPAFPFFCTEEEEPLSDDLKSKLVDKMVSGSLDGWRYELNRAGLFTNIKVLILKGLRELPDAAKQNISLTFKVVDSKLCGPDCAPADNEKDPELPEIDDEQPEEPEEGDENVCYTSSVKITHTIDGETKTETYRFFYTGDGSSFPEPPTLETIDNYFSNYRGTNLPPDWLDIDGVTIDSVEPELLGQVFWFPINNGCNNNPPEDPQPDEPVPAPEPSPPPVPTPTPQPKPDKVINVELDGCDDKIVANIGLYNKLLTNLVLEIAKSIIDVMQDRDTFKKFSPGAPKTKSNTDSLTWIGSKESSSMKNSSSVRFIIQDNGWSIFLESAEDSVDIPVGFRFSSAFNIQLKFSAILNVKCGEDTKQIPIFFGHLFDSSLILPNSDNNTILVKFNRLIKGQSQFRIDSRPGRLAPILAKILTKADLQINSDIIKNNNGLEYKDFVANKIANSLQRVVTEVMNESKKLSDCDCCLQSITDIKIVDALFKIKDITTLGGDSIFRPELRFGGEK